MRTRFFHIWDKLTSSYWFVPAAMTVIAVVLALAMLHTDRVLDLGPVGRSWFYSGDADGARGLLGTVASSTITVAGVVFSITISTLTLASSQFGPRLLRTFMRDTGNQIVLGTFVSAFLYCLLVLRAVRGENNGEFVPHISVAVAVLFAVASIVVLIYFIHHVSQSLQAPRVVATAGRDLDEAIGRMFPGQLGQESDTSPAAPQDADEAAADACAVSAARSGYVQAIDDDGLMSAAVGHDVCLRLSARPGKWIMRGTALAHVQPAGRFSDELAAAINDAFLLGTQRTAEQDVDRADIQARHEAAVTALRA